MGFVEKKAILGFRGVVCKPLLIKRNRIETSSKEEGILRYHFVSGIPGNLMRLLIKNHPVKIISNNSETGIKKGVEAEDI